jgi:hypothetical protein
VNARMVMNPTCERAVQNRLNIYEYFNTFLHSYGKMNPAMLESRSP